MENSLYQEKVAILSRLIKDSSLTLEEALLLLKEEDLEEEEEVVPESPIKYVPGWLYGQSNNPYLNPNPLIGGGTLPTIYNFGSTGLGTTTCTTVSNANNTTTFLTADLNN